MNFTPTEIVGKTLYATKNVTVYSKYPGGPVYRVVPSGKPVGVVWSYLAPKPGRPNLWWVIKEGEELFYVKHEQGNFDDNSIKEQIEAEQARNPWIDAVTNIGMTAVGGLLAVEVFKWFFSRK